MIISRYTINFSDFTPFYEMDLPMFLNTVPGLTVEMKERIARNVNSVSDMPSFQLLIQRLIKDIRIYTSAE